MKWETKNLRTQQNRKVNNKAKNKHTKNANENRLV